MNDLLVSDKADHVRRTPTPAEVVARMVVVDWFGALFVVLVFPFSFSQSYSWIRYDKDCHTQVSNYCIWVSNARPRLISEFLE